MLSLEDRIADLQLMAHWWPLRVVSTDLIPLCDTVEFKELVPVINGHIWVTSTVEVVVHDMLQLKSGVFYCNPATYSKICEIIPTMKRS